MIVQEESEETVMAELTTWQRRTCGGRVQLVSPAGEIFTSSSSLISFLHRTRPLDTSQSWEQVKSLFRLREKERSRRSSKRKTVRKSKEKILSGSKKNTISIDNQIAGTDFRQLLPSQPLSRFELRKVDIITSTTEYTIEVSDNLEDLDDIDFPRLEEERMICDVPLTFRKETLKK